MINMFILKYMKKGIEHYFTFWFVVLVMYTFSIALSFERIYVSQDFPIFYTEEEIPDPLSPIKDLLNFFTSK